jgi:hypothetical protein
MQSSNSYDDSEETQGSVVKLLKDHTVAAFERKNKYGQSLRDGEGSTAPVNDMSQTSSYADQTLCSKKRRLIEKFENQAELSSGDIDLARRIDSEVHSYLNFDVRFSANDNALQFWETHQHIFPYLAVLARNYLCVSASSVPVEQMFSSTGILLNQKRSSMAPCRANVVSFIHDNYRQFFPLSYHESTE